MNRKVIITSAVTGAGDTVPKSEHVPVTPEQIAASAIGSARAGAAVVHVHVRNVETGRGSRDVALYREAVKIIRESDVDFVLNLTAGMGGDLLLDQNDPTKFDRGHGSGQCVRPAAARRGTAPGHLHAGLRLAQLRRRQPAVREHAGHAARRREADPGARGEAGDGDLRHRASLVRDASW